jgi:hypothetical protein
MSYLNEPKRSNTQAFVNYINALPRDEMLVPPELSPATSARLKLTNFGSLVRLVDDNNNGVNSPIDCTLNIPGMPGPIEIHAGTNLLFSRPDDE